MADFGEYTPMYAQTGFDGRWWNEEYNEILHGFLPQDWASLNRLGKKINHLILSVILFFDFHTKF